MEHEKLHTSISNVIFISIKWSRRKYSHFRSDASDLKTGNNSTKTEKREEFRLILESTLSNIKGVFRLEGVGAVCVEISAVARDDQFRYESLNCWFHWRNSNENLLKFIHHWAI